jgi:osmotically-inducible protein OsmY
MARRAALVWLALALAVLSVLAVPRAGAAEDRLLGRRLKDAAITALDKARIVAARPASITDIDVDTDEGSVRLRGTVPGPAEWAEAQRVASGTPGVRRVWNELRLEETVSAPGSG